MLLSRTVIWTLTRLLIVYSLKSKDNPGSKSKGANSTSNRGGKGGSDRYIGRSSASYNVSEPSHHGKSTHKRENGSTRHTNYISTPYMSENIGSWGSSGLSDSAETKESFAYTADGMTSAAQPSGFQTAWMGVPGQVSMADVVRMGRPNNKPSVMPNSSHHIIQNPSTTESFQVERYTEDHSPGALQSEALLVQNAYDEWPSVEEPEIPNVVSVPEYSTETKLHPGTEGVTSDSVNLHPHVGVQEIDDDKIGNSGGNNATSSSIPKRKNEEDDSRGASLSGNDLHEKSGSYQSEASDFEQEEDDEIDASVTSVTRNLQQLSVEKDENGFPSEENTRTVVIPEHLQVQTVDCSHLNFGSFRPNVNPAYSSGPTASVPVETNLDLVHDEADISSVGHSDTRHSEYYVDGSISNDPDSGLFHRAGANVGSYDTPSAPQPEELKPESAEVVPGNQYSFPSSSGYAFDDQPNLTAPFNRTGSQMPDLAPFLNVMHHHTNSLPSTLLAENAQPNRESELQYSAFPVTQSLSSKYGNAASSIGASAISMSEALRNAGLSSTQPTPQTLLGANVATGPPMPQQLALHYSQPTLPLGPYASMMGYPFLPQSYGYLPSAFPQSLPGGSTYHQSLASVLPQYKSSVSVTSLPQSAAVPSGYGAALGGNATVPGSYSAMPSGTNLSYDDVLNSQLKDNAHLLMQQNENLAAWLHGPNPRTMPAQYNYPGHNQQLVGLRQGQPQQQQQLPQSYGTPGYPNFYHSQSGNLIDQQQNPRDGSHNNPQGQPKQSQMWPNNY
ncbi:uncharacterized protein LOC127254517 isoform X2 [Andrographis paniculata]|uniref:uncharacterized protein LOC127254517 isoform X2 n=1 Tax=Andrographis paniculata TaxID=175694 RepID=UPI0021E72EDE|nr:uncharacterized protein LOC127254517 isoform X2 [Andrographis paniculata]